MKNIICKGFVFLAFAVLPAYFENKYFNMLEAKWHAYVVGTSVLLAAAAIVWLARRPGKPETTEVSPDEIGSGEIRIGKASPDEIMIGAAGIGKGRPGNFNLTDAFVLGFGLCAAVSCFCSGQAAAAWLGTEGWHIGGYTIVTLVVWYFYLSRNMELSSGVWLAVLLVNAVLLGMVLLHAAGVDALFLHRGILESEYHSYLSTIGQMNWVVGYMSLVFPLYLGSYLGCTERASARVYEAFLLLCCLVMVLTASDGMYLAMGVMTVALIPLACRRAVRLERCFRVVTMYGASLMVVAVLPIFASKRAVINGVSGFFASVRVAALVMLAGIAGAVLVRWLSPGERTLRRLGIAAELGLGAFIVRCFVLTSRAFDMNWGTGRGRIWTSSFEIFGQLEWPRKLVGIGPELLSDAYAGLEEFIGLPVFSSHSEPIQILLTMGAAGLAMWLGLWLCLAIGAVRRRMWREDGYVYLLSLAAYLGQSIVNSATTTNVAMLIVIFACYRQALGCGQRSGGPAGGPESTGTSGGR